MVSEVPELEKMYNGDLITYLLRIEKILVNFSEYERKLIFKW